MPDVELQITGLGGAPDVAHYLLYDALGLVQQGHPVAREHGHGQAPLDKIVERACLAAHLAAVLGEEARELADPDGVRTVHGLGPLRPLATEANFAKQHVETDPGEGDGIDEGQPGEGYPDGTSLHHHPQGDPCHDHGVKQQQQPAEKAGKQQLNVVFQTVEQGDSLVYWTDGTGRPHRVGMVCYGAHPFYQVVSMILQSMLLSLAMLGQGSYDINEQQINQYLQSQVQVDKQLELPGIIKAHVQLEQSDVQIGRQSPDTARVFGKGKLKIALPDQTEYDARLNMTYEARPRYDKAKSALFLDNMKLIDYKLEPAAAEQKFGFMLRMLLQSMEKRLETQPVYKLDDKDPNQAWLKENLLGLELSPGKIHLLTKPQ